jgi:hypothetical protein
MHMNFPVLARLAKPNIKPTLPTRVTLSLKTSSRPAIIPDFLQQL